jgi:hypothetical protein
VGTSWHSHSCSDRTDSRQTGSDSAQSMSVSSGRYTLAMLSGAGRCGVQRVWKRSYQDDAVDVVFCLQTCYEGLPFDGPTLPLRLETGGGDGVFPPLGLICGCISDRLEEASSLRRAKW